MLFAASLAASLGAASQPPSTSSTTKAHPHDETLRYSVNWPSGLSLGEAEIQSSNSRGRWRFGMSLDASVPGFAVNDSYQSIASADFCSVEFTKRFTHGRRKANERTTFDSGKCTAERETMGGGGKSEMSVPACARDALAYLFFLRRELAEGRLPGPQAVYFGSAYQVHLEYGGRQSVSVNDVPTDTDLVIASFKGPASEAKFDIYFAHDAARTPVMVRVPLGNSSFSLELVR